MRKKRRITPAIGRTPGKPELQSILDKISCRQSELPATGLNISITPERQVEDALIAYREQHPDIYIKFWKGLSEKSTESKGDMTGVNKCSFRYKNPQVQQIPREDLVNMDYAVIEQRVVAMHPALAAPYGQTEKDQSDDQ